MVVASWMDTPVPDEVLPPSDRGERSETFSLGGEGYPRGIAKGDAPLASFLPYLSRSKDRVGGAGGRSAPVRRGRQRRPKGTFPENYRFPPARVSGQKSAGGPQARSGGAAKGGPKVCLAESTTPRTSGQKQRAVRAHRPTRRVCHGCWFRDFSWLTTREMWLEMWERTSR